jgi:hypothetical protein
MAALVFWQNLGKQTTMKDLKGKNKARDLVRRAFARLGEELATGES